MSDALKSPHRIVDTAGDGNYSLDNVLIDRQTKYLKNCKKSNITETSADLETYLILEFQNDIYCITFVKFIQSNDAMLHRELMLKCALTFCFQVLLIYLVAFEKAIVIF